jgi:Myb/SANT-like DNA-binding domain
MPTRVIWDDPETDLLVRERRRRNDEYHTRYRGNKIEFWKSVSRRIYRRYNRRYTARQCELKWRNLVRDYGVSKIKTKNNMVINKTN